MEAKLEIHEAELMNMKNDLKRTIPVVKRILPTKEDIENERKEIETEKRNSKIDQFNQTGLFNLISIC